jgi:anti-sigma B factor antagonist
MIEIAHEDGWVVVRLSGDIDLASAPTVRSRLNDVLAFGPENVRIDLGEVGFMDSQGLNILAGIHKRAQELGGQIRLVGVPDHIRRLLELTGLDTLLDVQPSRDTPPPGSGVGDAAAG